MEKIILTPLKIISHPLGDLYHILKSHEESFIKFGEAYFSTIEKGAIKGWKKHLKMTLNLVVPQGKVRFVIVDENTKQFNEVILSLENYQRLTVSPGLLVAFQGLEKNNLILNIADLAHDPAEVIRAELDHFPYSW